MLSDNLSEEHLPKGGARDDLTDGAVAFHA
jgi:hypothetical protein